MDTDTMIEDLKTATAVATYDSGKYLEIIERASLKLYGRVLSTDEFAARIEHDPNEEKIKEGVLVHMICDEDDSDWWAHLPESPRGSDKVYCEGVGYSIVDRTWEISPGTTDRHEDVLLVITLELLE